MVITWVTLCSADLTQVKYGENGLDSLANGYEKKFIDGVRPFREKKNFNIKAILDYCVGNNNVWSKIYSFTTMKNGENWSPRWALFGDLATISNGGRSHGWLIDGVNAKKYDIIFHIGDFAYNMDSSNGKVGDQFMREIEPIAAKVPYMVCVGNHEQRYNFSNYNNRFTMINEADQSINNYFYSFNIGPAHIISFSTEFYYFTRYGQSQIMTQYQWLERDLIEANKPENRMKRPWIITFGHRPMICSNDNHDDSTNKNSRLRKGMPKTHLYGLENLFFKYGVDIEFWAHQHSYERLWPFYDFKVYNGSLKEPYKNPKAPVHIITGFAGHKWIDTFHNRKPEWSAFRTNDYGFTNMTILNKTHVYIGQYSVRKNETFDEIIVRKEFHGPYEKLSK
ncbi:iron/zinc purple acid phosphatase-like protein [Dinothrombium tinctorium]|uniref:Iron/zinc purple acid phosphatase-like protein n=1 Tax=Dinothrombium tinctorium TaxID=1965070 RepID=A0A3S4QI18_9ACAR|nr:iron/zinc purple acid phosphatase-like protein [Dinothrombium tinctorium]RWS03862.1 iron/zinc purple acid phosphatase-like protein [Dinothrombium tinctorium]RWS12831.1 iron/zinc purple acid phosphatase-like protein [Dinothrombium tinctorium]